MKVELKLYPMGGIDCLSKTCSFRKECANHESAGDYRSEDGFRPDLFEKNGEYFCNTADEPMMDLDDSPMAQYGTFPKNYNELPDGELLKRDLEAKSVINFTI
jgi:hypothetical protein